MDDTLVRAGRMRTQIQRLLAKCSAGELTVDEARRLARRIQRKGPEAVRALIDCLFDETSPNNHRLAVLLLTEMNDPAVLERIHQLLARPQLPERVRTALLAVEALREGFVHRTTTPETLPELSLDSLLQFTENFWESMELEEITMLWRENFSAEPAEDRVGLLEALMRSAHPRMLGVARLELELGDVKMLQFLAQKLGLFDDRLAERLLQRLLQHTDLLVRTLADQSLARRRERLAQAPRKPKSLLPPVRFHRAYMATDEWSGQYSLVYSVHTADDRIKFFVVLLDRWDRGVIDCWGCVRYSREDFEKLLANMARDFSSLYQRKIPKKTALTLLHKAMELNRERRHPLPLDFAVWAHLFENERHEPDPEVPEFGVDCSVCRKPIRTGPRLPPPWVFGQLVVCHRCSKRTLHCPICGGPATLTECFLTREDSDDPIDLRCPHCFESLQMPQ